MPKERRQKLDPKSAKCILVGYEESAGSKVYRLYDAEKKRFLSSRDVIIDQLSVTTPTQEQTATTIGWDKESLSPAPEDDEPSTSDFRPLDSIIRPLIQPEPSSDIQDRITVRAPLPSPQILPTQQSSSAT